MSPAPSALFEQFLHALGDPQAGEALYRLHAPDAPLALGQRLGACSSLDGLEYARAHRDISQRGQDLLPRFGRAVLLRAPDRPDEPEGVWWFELQEMRESRRLVAALGLRLLQDGARVGWCTLAADIQPWNYRQGLLQSLADYPWLRLPAQARVLLDASYFRHHWRSPVAFEALPGARFSCQMSTACCKHDFEIGLHPDAQLIIDAMPWSRLKPELAATRLAVRADGKLQLKALNETCRFLGAQRQCLIHQTLGRQPFGPCAVFPFAFAHTPEGVAVSLSPICGSTRLGLGLAPQERLEDLRERLVHAEPRRAAAYRLAPGVDIPWESFRDIERALRDCLAAEELPLRRRLHVGSRLLGALKENQPIDSARWLAEPPVQITEELRAAIHGMLLKIIRWDRAALRTLPADIPPGLGSREAQQSPIVVRILQNTLHAKVYSYPYDLTTAHNFLIVLYLVTLIMQAASDAPLSDLMWQELGSLGVHGLLSNVLHEGVPPGFRALFGTSEFGQWALAA